MLFSRYTQLRPIEKIRFFSVPLDLIHHNQPKLSSRHCNLDLCILMLITARAFFETS